MEVITIMTLIMVWKKNNEKSSFDKEKMQKNAQCQLGSCCVFAAVNALLCGFGKNNPAGWLGIAITYASNNNILSPL